MPKIVRDFLWGGGKAQKHRYCYRPQIETAITTVMYVRHGSGWRTASKEKSINWTCAVGNYRKSLDDGQRLKYGDVTGAHRRRFYDF